MKSAITICLVPEAARGPFVFHEGLSGGCEYAADKGFHAVEIFPPDARNFPKKELEGCLKQTSLKLAAVGTGAGWLKKRLSLTDTDPNRRQEAIQFVSDIIDLASEFDAPAIIGSMQGQASDITHRSDSLHLLADALSTLGDRAMQNGQVLLYEALNRYETNLLNTQEDAANFLIEHALVNNGVRLLCDLFHMNIEEVDVAETITRLGSNKQDLIGHIHWADSNRRAMGFGHTDSTAIYQALNAVGYDRYLAAEVFPLPSPAEAANQTIASIKVCAPS
ncbi:sugar phosphate isomerase/epimerase [Planctomycetaceae bacterium]|nr:sugar phosphate isomerase/epimerase [Planctomycetaceae bacterium]